MKKRKNFRRKPKKHLQGLQVEVYDGQVEKAIRILKKKVKESNLFLELQIAHLLVLLSFDLLFSIQSLLFK